MKTLIYMLLFAICFVACSKETERDGKVVDYPYEENNQNTSSEDDDNQYGHEDAGYPAYRHVPADNYIQRYVEPSVMNLRQDEAPRDIFLPSISVEIAGVNYAPSCCGEAEYSIKIGATQFVYDYEIDPVWPVGYIPKDDESVVLPIDKEEMRATMKENVMRFNELAKLLGDTCFPGELTPLSNGVINDTIFAIDVICNEDFDENHKKGDSVNDFITFYGSTPYHYVTNGYNWLCEYPFSAVPYGLLGEYRDFIICKVDDIAEQETKYCSEFFHLYFDQLPETSGTYTFDVIVKFTDKELKNTITMVF